ncbi:MAG: glutamine-hydrolyzing carbamoyl-phosphate synthase small subunit [Betaproteobacteria bacterium AqS2]|uniref:Carbamoyl phosphate synthase small chain n=1 Tax=Candidatus Amphirhobacter heronislandensis TaxID=1732024 RepID=A0A930Y258_9GAMM|nr:glutamine-hydrolyzing carbamoyl-phosphate synthase small subunit [Betaproteobacteria bacterium AqS2]
MQPIAATEAILALATGETFAGAAFGHPGPAAGELVFNTSMTGYQEIVTDPSYLGQVVCLTTAHVGVVGVNAADEEAGAPRARGLAVRALARVPSSWRAEGDLDAYCRAHGVCGIAEVDTRALAIRLREGGAVNCCVLHGGDRRGALRLARACPPMAGQALGRDAGVDEPAAWHEGAWDPGSNRHARRQGRGPKVAVLDCGAKRAILRCLRERGLRVEVLPLATPAAAIAKSFAALVVSNGPGDPGPLAEAASALKAALKAKLPVLGICLGHQLLAQACGARTAKMKFGHHGANHPVLDLRSGQVAITSQNHGFVVAAEKLPRDLELTHVSLFDRSVQGFRHRRLPALGFQGHPEASPGPREMEKVFDEFAALVRSHAAQS